MKIARHQARLSWLMGTTGLRAALGLALSFAAVAASAATPPSPSWLLTGSASSPLPTEGSKEVLWLTDGHPDQVGSAWFTAQTLDVSRLFELSFTFKITGEADTYGGYLHSDGFALVLQGERPDAIGVGYGGLGYYGIRHSLALAVDTWENQPYGDHGPESVCWISRGPLENRPDAHLACKKTSRFFRTHPLANTRLHHVRVRYDGQRLSAHIDQKYTVNVTLGNLGTYLGLPATDRAEANPSRVWAGFTAANGEQSFDRYEIRDFALSQ